MAFRFRKQNPGSGGARRGAGRRPDISRVERFAIGHACARRYADLCASRGRRKWCDGIFELWQTMLDDGQDKQWLTEKIRERYELEWDELGFVMQVASMDEALFNVAGDYAFDLKSRESLLGTISDTIYGLSIRPRSDYTPPRNQIMGMRKQVIDEVVHELSRDQNGPRIISRPGPLTVSESFVMRCWIAYGLDERPV